MSEPTEGTGRGWEAVPGSAGMWPGQAPPWPAQEGQPYAQPQPPWGSAPPYAQGSAMQPHGQAMYPAPYPAARLVSPGGRLGAALLDGLLIVVTLGIGWAVWALISWASGQTPGKQLLHQVVADGRTGQPFGWGGMFVREFLVRGLLFGVANMLTAGIFGLVDVLMVFREDHRTLHDMVSGSVVRYL
jgi:uncharacterized RDD family membrane protein YckC